ncbi:MAG TPA: YhjD/YihY/BrkB family envelope integrity protein [Burkholderiaceae bacterium]|jgi:membrane protein|nr:YhjD/YihY/BrkB family envelope integrity protein [Burkholderiaceae bacterium]
MGTTDRSGTAEALAHPLRFAMRVLKGFRANQGLLLAGAVAYYVLLSLIPLLVLVMIALSHVVDEAQLLQTMSHYLEFVTPGQSAALVQELRTFVERRAEVGVVLVVTMLFFSALAFTVLENAMSVIFFHRVRVRRRHIMISAVMPYLFVLIVGTGLLIVTIVAGALRWIGAHDVLLFGGAHSLDRLSALLLYALGVGGEILLLTAIYLVMPVGRISWRHALIGAGVAALLWEITRHAIAWYFTTISQIQVLYGSFATAIMVLLSVEIGAIVLLLGAQVIAEFERIRAHPLDEPPQPMRTTQPPPD